MELTKEQEVLQQVINEAWENETFKAELMASPVAAIENLTGEKLDLKGKELIVRDQTDESTIYINIPQEQSLEDIELNEEQLEAVAGGQLISEVVVGYGDKPNTLPIVPLGDPNDNKTTTEFDVRGK